MNKPLIEAQGTNKATLFTPKKKFFKKKERKIVNRCKNNRATKTEEVKKMKIWN